MGGFQWPTVAILKAKEADTVGHHHDNWVDDTMLEFPRGGFWFIHVIGAVMVFFLGMRFAMRRAPLSIMAYRFLRMLRQR